MQTLQLRVLTSEDGSLALSVPTPLPCQEVEVTVTYRSLTEEPRDDKGWPVGWIARTAGSVPDLERPPQGEYEVREEW
jgi:hypothetical protein